jgi:hypothetical protein
VQTRRSRDGIASRRVAMLGSITKRVVIRILEKSGNPQLQEFAKWIKDAEGRAVDLVMDVLARVFKSGGKLDQSTVDEIAKIKSGRTALPAAPPYEAWTETSPYLVEYARFVAATARLAAWRGAIYLDGFFHSAACTSLWVFESKELPDVDIALGARGTADLVSIGRQVKVFILERMSDADRNAANERLGSNFTAWSKATPLDDLNNVISVTEDEVNVYELRTVPGKKRQQRDLIAYPIMDRNAGLQALYDSLEPAIEARDQALIAVRKKSQEKP